MQSQSHIRAVDRYAVLAVVEQSDAEAVLGQVAPFVAADLELRRLMAVVARGRALGVTELHLMSRRRRGHVYIEADLEQRVLFMPVDKRVEVDSRRL